MHSGIVGNALIDHCPFYIFTVVASIGVVGLVGWKRTVYSLLFLCKKIFSLFTKVLFFRLRKTTGYSIAPLAVEEKYRTTRQQLKERQKKATEEIFKPPSSEFEFPSIHLLSKVEESMQRK